MFSTPYLFFYLMMVFSDLIFLKRVNANENEIRNGFIEDQDKVNAVPNYYDFWIGKWDVYWEEDGGKIGRGVNIVEHILEGNAIQENFLVTQGKLKGFQGISISTIDKKANKWKQVWKDNKGGYFEFIGDTLKGMPVFKTQPIEREGRQLLFRMVFNDIQTNSFIWQWEKSSDGGILWELKWRIFYKRKDI